jgi:hypothetical protein
MATQGTLIRATDFNTLQTQVSDLLGSGSASFGYGQSVASSQVTAFTDEITALQWATLKSDILKIAAHQGNSADPIITAIPVIAQYAEIGHNDITNFETAVPFLSANRFALAEYSDETFNPVITNSRNTPWGAPDKPVVRHSFTIDFGSADNARYFFKTGGQIRMSATLIPDVVTSQNTNWSNLLSYMGTIVYNYNGTTAAAGTGSSIGYYSLTNIAQQVFTKTGAGAYTDHYNANDYLITMSCDVANNSTGTARYLYVAIYFNDEHTGVSDSVTGILTSEVSIRRATGSHVEVVKPTATNTILLTS